MRYLELPDELLPLTLRGLSPDELAVAAAVCTALRRVSEADSLWADVDLQLPPTPPAAFNGTYNGGQCGCFDCEQLRPRSVGVHGPP